MVSRAKGFGLSFGASVAAVLLAGAIFLALAAWGGASPGAGSPLRWGVVLLPQALAAAAAGFSAATLGAVAINALGFFLPQAAAAVLGFLLFAHPGGPGGLAGLVGTWLFWAELGAFYLAALLLVGLSSAVARALFRR